MDSFYKVLKERQALYDKYIDKLIQGNDPQKELKIENLMIKNEELQSIIWTMKAMMDNG